jgi:hypothetical protein
VTREALDKINITSGGWEYVKATLSTQGGGRRWFLDAPSALRKQTDYLYYEDNNFLKAELRRHFRDP